ncbi:MAG: hypothetical protein ACOH5I_25625 [Oligoflexus sp.]
MADKKDYKIQKKRNGRYSVVRRNGVFVNGEEKLKILTTEGLVKAPKAKAKPAEEA